MLAFFQNMTLGKWIVVVCATLFCIVAIVFLRDLLTKKKEEEEKPVSPEESEKVKLEPLLVGSLQKTHQLEDVINQKISNMKLDLMAVPAKNAASKAALSKPDIGPQSSPNARAAIIR